MPIGEYYPTTCNCNCGAFSRQEIEEFKKELERLRRELVSRGLGHVL